ncbi:MAG: histidine kinase N-terminal 7TM domain-containing protein [Deltaproteobacteria bacterium]
MLFISILLILFMAAVIIKMKNKQQIHIAFLSILVFLFLWSLIRFIQIFFNENIQQIIFLEHLSYIGVCLVPLSVLFTGIIFAKTKINFSWKYLILFIIPILSLIMVFTNNYHHLFIEKYSFISTEFVYGKYYMIHEIYSYLCIAVGLYYLLYFSIKNSGFFSKQSFLIMIGLLVPFVVIILSTQKMVAMPVFIENISFSVTTICLAFAIFKFDFLNVIPIALEKVVDNISDSFIVINEDFEVIDYNKTFVRTFAEVFKIKRKENLINLVTQTQGINIVPDKVEDLINIAIETKKSNMYEKRFVSVDGDFDKYFEIEITPIMSKTIFVGVLLLFRDITLHKENLEKINQAHNQLMQKERLASLGEIAGGVAHDINSPLSSIQTELHIINTLAARIEESGQIVQEKELQYLNEIKKRIQNISNASQKIVKIVNSVRNHTRNLSGETVQDFYIGSIFDDLKILLDHQLKQAKCELTINKEEVMINGDPGKLSQVITNLIMNAAQAYAGNPGRIDIDVSSNGEKAIIKVTDYAGGIPKEFQEGIFKNILTTKGTQGTGFGLYLCNSIITGHFGGEIWFKSEEGIGTTFFISIAAKKAS